MRLALYAHYAASAEVRPFVLHYLEAIREEGFRIIFISNSAIAPSDDRRLSSLCEHLLLRPNIGFDFAMWKAALDKFGLKNVDELLLTNSSIIGPLAPLGVFWSKPSLQKSDFWGLTENCDMSAHLQSYFLVFRRRVIEASCFSEFWNGILPFSDKMQVIRSYEIGLTLWLAQNGFSWEAAFPAQSPETAAQGKWGFKRKLQSRILRQRQRGPNATLSAPETLIRAGMPFMKRELLTPGNPYMAPRDALCLLRQTGLPSAVVADLENDAAH